MKEIDIKQIIMNNFRDRIAGVKFDEYPSIYDTLHSTEYRKAAKQNFPVISEGFNVAEMEFYYMSPRGSIPMKVTFGISFDFEYAWRKKCDWGFSFKGVPNEYPCGKKFSVKPVLGIDEIGIELSEIGKINRDVYKLLYNNIPHGRGGSGKNFSHYSICGMHCEGHPYYCSHVKLEQRIINFFNYLFGMVDQACDYEEHPDHKPKIVEVEQTSYYDEDDYPDYLI